MQLPGYFFIYFKENVFAMLKKFFYDPLNVLLLVNLPFIFPQTLCYLNMYILKELCYICSFETVHVNENTIASFSFIIYCYSLKKYDV